MSRAGGSGAPPAPPQEYEVAGKVMLLGDSGVGKTCFLLQFRDGAFLSGTFIATVGIDFRNKVVAVDGVKVKLQIWDTAGQERFRSVTHAYYRDAQALLLLYDITSKMSFDNIRVSAPAPRASPGMGNACFTFWDPGSSELVPWARFVSGHCKWPEGESLGWGFSPGQWTFVAPRTPRFLGAPCAPTCPPAGCPQVADALPFPQADVSSERAVRTEDGASLAREYGVPFMETSAKTGMNVELAFLAIAKELKQRALQPPDEPRFQIHDYIEAQQKKSGCCAFA
ncbi:ras-related protein Rab-37 [Oxyura jamaicensis]|uniref:ras-related protein Rab-37 n=1 Tax=Oxyura jamaicensis TaxID=8884 RepID=UPI0015A59096|nr:ras-related protein Rab-37 [Oxyura jamaicensis]